MCHDPRTGNIEIARAAAAQLSALPQLKDVLARYQDRAFLDIEVKVAGLEKIVLALLQKYPPRRGLVVSSFLPQVLRELHAQNPTVPLGLICETKAQVSRWSDWPVEFVIPYYKLVDATLLRELKAAQKKILVWTVNAPADMRRLADSGVDGIISDDTGLLCRSLAAEGRAGNLPAVARACPEPFARASRASQPAT